MRSIPPLKIAVVGSGISGLSAAWLLSSEHDVTVFEKDTWIGGHSHTVDVDLPSGPLAVDTGFIVYNERNYPNLTALFEHLSVPTEPSDMSFSASVQSGRFEYSGGGLTGLLAQKRNLVRPRFWSMVLDITRFYRSVVGDALLSQNAGLTLGDYLERNGYSASFLYDHILPMGSSIWSSSIEDMRGYPLEAFVRFFQNHGLLELKAKRRPKWRTVSGGSREYVERLIEPFKTAVRKNAPVARITRHDTGVVVHSLNGVSEPFDHVLIATHADQALNLIDQPTPAERALLGAVKYETNVAHLHRDSSLMPRRKRAWSSWNYISEAKAAIPDENERAICLTYWMNRLQNLDARQPVAPGEYPEQIFVTLNPHRPPADDLLFNSFVYEHPIFDGGALQAQRDLWSIQGDNHTWFAGAHFGHGFHEDGLQAGLAVAEALGSVRRPWSVEDESGRLSLPDAKAVAA